MTYEEIFTVPDKSLFKEGSLDPMGTQSIWSAVGQKIFKNKLNTISTDIRNYSINLFNHYLIRKVFNDHYEWVNQIKQGYKLITDDYDFRASLVLVLEDILTGSLVYQAKSLKKDNVSIDGILGSYKAEIKLGNEFEHEIIMDKNKGGFLVRQLSLGVNGRYKGPFMNMNLLSRDLKCIESEWQKVDELFKVWKETNSLLDEMIKVLEQLIKSGGRNYPSLSFAIIRDNHSLQNAIADCFGTKALNPHVKRFWEAQLGLTEGAAQVLYQNLQREMTPKELYLLAHKTIIEAGEKQKINEVIELESFLSPCTQTFYLLTQNSIKNIAQVKSEAVDLMQIIQNRSNTSTIINAEGRLKELRDLIKEATDPESLLRNLATYHQKVFKSKGSPPWISIKEDGTIERMHNANPAYATQDFIENEPWYNNYYIGTLKAIRHILTGMN